MLNTAMRGSKKRCQGGGRVERRKVKKDFVEEVFLNDKMNSTEKKAGRGRTNKIKMPTYTR